MKLEKDITELSHELQKPAVKYAWYTTLWQYSATTYGSNKNRICRASWARMKEREYLYIAIIRRRGGKHMQILKWEFKSKLHHWDSVYIFLWQAARNLYQFFFVSRLVVFFVFLFLKYPAYYEKSLLFRINILAHIMATSENKMMWDACHAQNQKIWLLSSSQLCASAVSTRSCPALEVSNSKEKILTVHPLQIQSIHVRLLIT